MATAFAVVLAAHALAPSASAQDRPVELRLRSGMTIDDNVFRLPDSAPDPQMARGISGKSDRFSTTVVTLVFDKAYAQQRAQFELSQTTTRYDKFSSLDTKSLDYRGTLLWRLTSRLSGALTASRSESPLRLEDTQGDQSIVRTTTNRGVTVDGWLFGGWHVLAGASETRTTSTQTFGAVPDSEQTGSDFGLRYIAPSQSTITATLRSQQGSLASGAGVAAGAGSSGFTATERELNASWIASGKSTLNGRLTRIERRYESFPRGDFTGVSGELGYAWTPTGKLSVSANALRTVAPFFTATTTYRTEDTLAVGPVLRVSDKATVRMRAARQTIEFRGPAGRDRRDTLDSLEFGADWAPHPRVTLTASLRRDQRSSTDSRAAFGSTIAAVNAAVRF